MVTYVPMYVCIPNRPILPKSCPRHWVAVARTKLFYLRNQTAGAPATASHCNFNLGQWCTRIGGKYRGHVAWKTHQLQFFDIKLKPDTDL